MLLPLGFDRKDDRKFQEVYIPPSDPPPTNVGKKLVPISQLDEVSQSSSTTCYPIVLRPNTSLQRQFKSGNHKL